jgi:phytol kinase
MRIQAFVAACIPSATAIVVCGPLFLAWSACCLWWAAQSKRRWGLATGYTRKLFHLLTFASAGALQLVLGLPYVCLFGGATTAVLAYAVLRGAGHPFYEALAREGDAPYRTHYIVVSYLATLIGGLLSNFAAGPFALCGYLVCGLGDAAGEPIGTRWGRHWYAVPARSGTNVMRSLEGSTAVFVVSTLALITGLVTLTGGERVAQAWLPVLFISATCALVEALSPHGWDNATLQVTPSLLAMLLIGR